ncbi:MAG TPA: alanine--tRNA ligase [Tepidisphaeraceae bacterium]|jgi:alanyl-tRNA synthetase|nr:alanine--tRNA ligase [Tepidisphaeraceae bacterium]
MTSEQIRRQFIDFFVQKHGHTFVPSSPVVPQDDPTLLFTNAGMNQFKPIFLGQEKRAYTRAANTQKCIRAGGKHNDLDDVGRSRRHHTFFEMLGNWSFGDYFKHGAIDMAWELLTKVWKLDPNRLHVSCYEGNVAAGIPRDTEAADIWKQVAGLPDDHIHYFGKDNFWEMGDTGPCGPCTEIYYDRRPESELHTPSPVNGEDPRVMEIWNNVFIQYNRSWKSGGEVAVRAFDTIRAEPLSGEDLQGAKDRIRLQTFGTIKRDEWIGQNSTLEVLPAQHVDTGMGLERICQVLQGKDDNFGTDLWTPLFERISQISNLKYTGQFPPTNAADPVAEAANPQLRHDIAFRVVADHIRCLTFALTDGAVPSNEGRGYVLRRILRRAARFGRQHLGLNEPFLHMLVPVVVEAMGGMFPELQKDPQRVNDLIKGEEVSFGRTLQRGIQFFEDAAAVAELDSRTQDGLSVENPKHDGWLSETALRPRIISGRDAFRLHDTYGFPIDLTRIMAEERGMHVDVIGYEKLMEEARGRARAGGKEQQSRVTTLPPDALAQLAKENIGPTNDKPKFSHEPIQAQIMAIWNGDDFGLSPANVYEDEELAIILDRTNFYSEMGGQVGDSGAIASATAVFDVETTKSVGGYVLHIGRIRNGKLRVTDTVTATVTGRRERTEKNHTSTHLANWALREVLGEDVQQKGSLVDPEKLRFDFSHGKSLSEEELGRVETLVNERIGRKLPVYAEEAPQEMALNIHGLRAVFGEKYPPMVRVVSIGAPVKELLADPQNTKWREYSIEFCGGTHLSNSGDAAGFAITAEESVSKGIRRIVALTGDAAKQAADVAKEIDGQIERARAAKDEDLAPLIASLQKAITGTVPLRAKRRAQAAISELQARVKAFEKSNKSQAGGGKIDVASVASGLFESAAPLGPGKLIVGEVPGVANDQLLAVADSLKKKAGSYAVMLASAGDGKVNFVAAVSDDLVAKGLKAGDWLRETAKVAGGAGGGRPQMAQGSGKDPAKLNDALAAARDFATKNVK